jgi:hypothetical protein
MEVSRWPRAGVVTHVGGAVQAGISIVVIVSAATRPRSRLA